MQALHSDCSHNMMPRDYLRMITFPGEIYSFPHSPASNQASIRAMEIAHVDFVYAFSHKSYW